MPLSCDFSNFNVNAFEQKDVDIQAFITQPVKTIILLEQFLVV